MLLPAADRFRMCLAITGITSVQTRLLAAMNSWWSGFLSPGTLTFMSGSFTRDRPWISAAFTASILVMPYPSTSFFSNLFSAEASGTTSSSSLPLVCLLSSSDLQSPPSESSTSVESSLLVSFLLTALDDFPFSFNLSCNPWSHHWPWE